MEADYVVIGSGSAGSVLANRLSESGKYDVLVVEYGGSDAGPLIQMPGALSFPMSMPRYDWGYVSEPEPGLGGRSMVCPRGKVMGGSSSINGMVYVRGHKGDYDHWAESGASGWSWDDVEPFFRKMEHWHSGGHGGDEAVRGTNGPLHVSRGTLENPLNAAFIKAGTQAGYPYTGDYNGTAQEGFGPMDQSVWRGRRWSTANAYLKPALRRKNCKMLRGLVGKILISEGRARGVEVITGARTISVTARREVVLCASAINSPKLLMLSGIGSGEHLTQHGIDVVLDKPGVGQNLQDHLEVCVQQACIEPITLYRYWNWFGKFSVGLRWLLTKSGPGASNQFESGAFIRTGAEAKYPDVQFHFMPIAVRYDGKVASEGHGFQIHTGPMRSASRGSIRLRSSDPFAPPKIKFNYMTADDDWVNFRRAVGMAREVLAQPAFDRWRGKEIQPGESAHNDADVDAFIRNTAETSYHPCGTCKMGAKTDPLAVVDPQCRVIGIDALRVIDSSIFPRITYGNLNAPSIMTGEKGAHHVLSQSD